MQSPVRGQPLCDQGMCDSRSLCGGSQKANLDDLPMRSDPTTTSNHSDRLLIWVFCESNQHLSFSQEKGGGIED
jgi:hypothetical protein